ncbi:MAG: BadF/BadG/BcrA/BcrD ATPase family protein [Pseudomonadota bacterium]
MTDSHDTLIVGVDGGGTGCRAAIGTRSKGIIARAESGRANFASDPDLALHHVLSAVHDAASDAGIAQGDLPRAVAHLGLAGVMTAEDSQRVADAMPFSRTDVTNDRPTAVVGALGGQDGYLLAIGTGIIAAASVNGDMRVVNGWGFYVSDQGSGAWLGRVTLEQVLHCCDGVSAHSDVTRQVLARFGNDPGAISSFSVTAKPGDYARIAPVVIDGAQNDDPWSQELLSAGAAYLTRYLDALGFSHGDTLCLSGGLGAHYAPFLAPAALEGRITSRGSALSGAFQLASRLQEAA